MSEAEKVMYGVGDEFGAEARAVVGLPCWFMELFGIDD